MSVDSRTQCKLYRRDRAAKSGTRALIAEGSATDVVIALADAILAVEPDADMQALDSNIARQLRDFGRVTTARGEFVFTLEPVAEAVGGAR